MKNRFKVVMLPTEEPIESGALVLFSDGEIKLNTRDCALLPSRNPKKVHIYIVDTEATIEVGDWFIIDAESVCKCLSSAQAKNCEGEQNIYKIIFSTDTSLRLPVIYNFLQRVDTFKPNFNPVDRDEDRSAAWGFGTGKPVTEPQVDFEELQNFINFISNDLVKTLPVLHKEINNLKLFFKYIKNPSFAQKASKWFKENS